MKYNQKGMSSLLLILVILILGVGVSLIIKAKREVSTIPSLIQTITETGSLYDSEDFIEQKEFEAIEETEETPQEIDNETLEELDNLMNSINTSEEDFSDLEL